MANLKEIRDRIVSVKNILFIYLSGKFIIFLYINRIGKYYICSFVAK